MKYEWEWHKLSKKVDKVNRLHRRKQRAKTRMQFALLLVFIYLAAHGIIERIAHFL